MEYCETKHCEGYKTYCWSCVEKAKQAERNRYEAAVRKVLNKYRPVSLSQKTVGDIEAIMSDIKQHLDGER